jgi:hypothetical protein
MKQIFPSTITGPSFAEGGSVLDHNFGAGEPYTLGVEEEYMLLDAETFDLVQHVEAVLAATEGHELEPRINAELMQSVLEIATPVCHNPGDVMRELNRLGVDGMFDAKPNTPGAGLRRQVHVFEYFQAVYTPTEWVRKPYPHDDFDFSSRGAYSQYNWELFFHVPLMISFWSSASIALCSDKPFYHRVAMGGDAPRRRVRGFATAQSSGCGNTSRATDHTCLLPLLSVA